MNNATTIETTTVARIATHCAACHMPLTDAVSMERGIGPICSAKYYEAPPQEGCDLGALGRALEGTPEFAEFATLCAVAGDAKEEGDADKAAEIVGKFDVRKMANRLVLAIAFEQRSELSARYTKALGALGFTSLAERIEKKIGARIMRRVVIAGVARPAQELPPVRPAPRQVVRVDFDGSEYIVNAPYSAAFVERRRALGGTWHSQTRTNRFAASMREALWRDLCDCYPDHDVVTWHGITRRTPPRQTPAAA